MDQVWLSNVSCAPPPVHSNPIIASAAPPPFPHTRDMRYEKERPRAESRYSGWPFWQSAPPPPSTPSLIRFSL